MTKMIANPWLSQKRPENRHGTRTARAQASRDATEAREHGMPTLPARARKLNPRRAKKAWTRAEAGAAGRTEAAIRHFVMLCECKRIDDAMLANAR